MIRQVLSGIFKGSYLIDNNLLVNMDGIGGCFTGPRTGQGLELSDPIDVALLINVDRAEIKQYVKQQLTGGI